MNWELDGQAPAHWPLPKFYFQVQWGDKLLIFQEVSGLDVEAEPIEYRHGDSPVFSIAKMPDVKISGDITLKKGSFVSEDNFLDWFEQIKMNTVKKESVKISLLDESGAPTMVWTLANAWPSKITGTDLQGQGEQVAIESLEITHEGIMIENG